MSDPTTAPIAGAEADSVGAMSPGAPLPAPTSEAGVRLHPRPPRPGDLTIGWRAVSAGIWIGVVVGFAALWNASVQLGLSTWWLGARADPQPNVVRFGPFVVPMLMLLATINQVRWLGWYGLGASVAIAGFGLGDIGRVNSLAAIELAIAAAAAAASIASLTGVYRSAAAEPVDAAVDPPIS